MSPPPPIAGEYSWLVRCVLANARVLIANSHNTRRVLVEEWNVPPERDARVAPRRGHRLLHPHRVQFGRAGWAGLDRPFRSADGGPAAERKGQDMMIRALPAILRAVPDVLYAILGDGEERRRLQALAESERVAEHVQFVGEVNDARLQDCYRGCDLFALPNRQEGKDIEGFGMVLLEAQSCGRPVIAGASGGTAETMDIPGTGSVVNCDGPQQLAQLVIELLTDKPRLARMGQAARDWVVSRFDWSVLSRQAESLFRSCQRRPNRAGLRVAGS